MVTKDRAGLVVGGWDWRKVVKRHKIPVIRSISTRDVMVQQR